MNFGQDSVLTGQLPDLFNLQWCDVHVFHLCILADDDSLSLLENNPVLWVTMSDMYQLAYWPIGKR